MLVGIAAAGVTSTIRALPLNPLPTPEFSLPFAAFGSDSTPDPVADLPTVPGQSDGTAPDRSLDRASRSDTRTPLTTGEFSAAPAQPAASIPVQWSRDTTPDAVHWSRTPVVQPYQLPVVQPARRPALPVTTLAPVPAQPNLAAPSTAAPTSPAESAPATSAPADSTSAPAAAPVDTAPASTTDTATATSSTSTTTSSSTSSSTSGSPPPATASA